MAGGDKSEFMLEDLGILQKVVFYFVGFSFYLVYIGRSSDGFNKDYLRKDE